MNDAKSGKLFLKVLGGEVGSPLVGKQHKRHSRGGMIHFMGVRTRIINKEYSLEWEV